jgi:methionine--tRNA ligase
VLEKRCCQWGFERVPKFFLTTAIDYSNGDPHLGHALEKVGADAIARYRRLRGDQVHFLMGMDEHSQSVLQAAAKAGVSPQAWVDRMAERFREFWDQLECSNDDWIRTTEPRHARSVTELLRRIQRFNPDDLYVAEYEGLYCTGCEEFKQESQIVNGHCIEHPTLDLVATRERNHFFRLSRYRDELHRLITAGEFRVEPAIRRNEVLRLLEGGLQDISVSRLRQPWGIPFPGDPDQTVYVWFDALINYLSATGFPDVGYERLWPAELHVVGKGITRFHCVIWPAMLLAARLSFCVKWVSRRTAISPGNDSTSAIARTSRMDWGTWLRDRWRCWFGIATAAFHLTGRLPRWINPGERRYPDTRPPWMHWISAAEPKPHGPWFRPPTCMCNRLHPGRWRRPGKTLSWT